MFCSGIVRRLDATADSPCLFISASKFAMENYRELCAIWLPQISCSRPFSFSEISKSWDRSIMERLRLVRWYSWSMLSEQQSGVAVWREMASQGKAHCKIWRFPLLVLVWCVTTLIAIALYSFKLLHSLVFDSWFESMRHVSRAIKAWIQPRCVAPFVVHCAEITLPWARLQYDWRTNVQ